MKSTAEDDSAVQMLLDCLPEGIRFRVIRYLDFLMITAPAAAREATTARAMIPLSEVGSVVPPETVVYASISETIIQTPSPATNLTLTYLAETSALMVFFAVTPASVAISTS